MTTGKYQGPAVDLRLFASADVLRTPHIDSAKKTAIPWALTCWKSFTLSKHAKPGGTAYVDICRFELG
jgi:hypothetical protein